MNNGGTPEKEAFLVPDPLGPGDIEVLQASNVYGANTPPRRGKLRDVYDL